MDVPASNLSAIAGRPSSDGRSIVLRLTCGSKEHEVAIPLHHVAPVITYMLAMTKISSEKLSSEALAQLKTQKQLSPMPVTSLALRAGHLPGHETIELRFGHVGLAFQLRVEQLDALAGAITDRPGAAQPSGRKGPAVSKQAR